MGHITKGKHVDEIMYKILEMQNMFILQDFEVQDFSSPLTLYL